MGPFLEILTLYFTQRLKKCTFQVVTYTDSKEFIFRRWTDHSDVVVKGMKKTGLTLIRLEKTVRCGDRETTAEFNQKYEEFCDRNRNR